MPMTSGIEPRHVTRKQPDRRISRTRTLLLGTFNRLLLTRSYSAVSVSELAAFADVGRSTFYEHFETKDDLLAISVAPILATLAAAVEMSAPSDALHDVFAHLLEHRLLTGTLLQAPTRAILIRVLAGQLELHLVRFISRSAVAPIAPLAFLAESLAHVQLGAVDAWLCGDNCCDVVTAARVFHAMTRGGVTAMFGSTG